MFSSKFLSGTNPLSAVSSAVNKFGLFGDDGDADKSQKSGEHQTGADPSKGQPQQKGAPKSNQGSPVQRSQPPAKQGPPQLHGNGQAGPPKQPEGQPKGSQQQGATKPGGPPHAHGDVARAGTRMQEPQLGTAKVGQQQQQQGSPKPSPQQKGTPKLSPQQQGSPKPSLQQTGQPKPSVQQQGPPIQSQQQSGLPKPSLQQQGSPKPSPQEQSYPKVTPQQASSKGAAQQAQQRGPKGPVMPDLTRGSSICPVCNTTKLNMHTKEAPNHKECTRCKIQVCNLCGFSPPDADASEWLCLTCQIKRVEGPKMPTPSPSKMPSPAESGSPNRTQNTSAAKSEAPKGQASPKHTGPDSQKQHPEKTGPGAANEQASGGLFGFGASKTTKPEESVTGKMFGFGSSIFNSASTLITSAVQDEPKTTAPISPKLQTKPAAVQEKKLQPEEARVPTGGRSPSDLPQSPVHVLKKGQSSCPLCKMVFNMGSKDPPNYSNCTECRTTVCNQCGFNPMPNVKEGKEWLCLNCQVKRATRGIESPKDDQLATSPSKRTPGQPALQKTPVPGSPQRTPGAQSSKAEAVKAKDSQKQASPAPAQKAQQDNVKADLQKKTEQSQKQDNANEAPQQESGGFFSFGSPKKQPDTTKPTESVTGKMFGFGSSIFSSASTLMSSAVQDEPKPTPEPASPKMPASKGSTSVKKPEPEKKTEQSQQPKGDQLSSEPTKNALVPLGISKPVQSSCPVCKSHLNLGSKDAPNYNTCTECTNTVCNQCGFNPVPNVKEVREWLCLNCQMQRALGASDPPGTPMMMIAKKEKQQKSQAKDSPTPAESKVKETPRKESAKTDVAQEKSLTPALGPKAPSEDQKKGPQKPSEATITYGLKQTNSASKAQEESRSPILQADAVKPTDSIGGKMFSFGSSIFSSASTLINSAGQEEPKTTPPLSPKMPSTKVTKSALAQEQEPEKKQEPKSSTLLPSKPPSDHSNELSISQISPKEGQSTCLLCKVELNFDSKDPPNYSKCTECKKTVCNRCGFSPVPNLSKVKEWLCLNCQMQRAMNASETPMKPPNAVNKTPPSSIPQKTVISNEVEKNKKDILNSDMLPKMQTVGPGNMKDGSILSTPQRIQPLTAKEPEQNKQGTPVSDQEPQMKSGSQKPADPTTHSGPKQSKVTSDTQKPYNQSGSSGPKTTSDASKTTDSITGKMFGFGSSIFSSASTLISTAIQEESRTTPPNSRKMSAPVQVSSKMAAGLNVSPKSTSTGSPSKIPAKGHGSLAQEVKKNEESNQSKHHQDSSQSPKAAIMSHTHPNGHQENCPLCHVKLNIGTKEPPNYSTCSECKTVVCDKCGFNPVPIGEKKEWLCLTCQMKRAVEASGQPVSQNQDQAANRNAPAAVKSTDTTKPITSQTKSTLNTAEHPQEKSSTASVTSNKPETSITSVKLVSPAPDARTQQKNEKPVPEKSPDQASQNGHKQSNATSANQQETGGFFGVGATKSKPNAEKPTDSVSGKVFGFGSSVFSSATSLITTAVQDQPKTTPPASPKRSPAKELKSDTSQKQEPQKKSTESTQQANTPPSGSTTGDNKTTKPPKPAEATKSAVKPGSTCPLCKVGLHQANSNTCTECKNTVCNQCGFNPMPNETKEWLCLTCQMRHALVASHPPVAATTNSHVPAKDVTSTAETEKKVASITISPQRQPTVGTATPAAASLAANKPDGTEDSISAPVKKTPQDHKNIPGVRTSPGQTGQAERKKSNATESGGFFGFGGSKTQPDTSKPAESVTVKMFGFGSSIFNSASTLINSTPPVSPKMSPTKQSQPPTVQKKEQQTKPAQMAKSSSSEQTKVNKSQKDFQSICPLCKAELNIGSKELPNYDSCTNCKSTVCKQCGFNPMPNVSKKKEWLCLTCQMQRALSATKVAEPPVMKPQPSPKKVTTPAAATLDQIKDTISTQKSDVLDKNQKDEPTPVQLQKKEKSPGTVSGLIKDIKTGSPPTKEVQISSTPSPEEKSTAGSIADKPLTEQASPVWTDVESSLKKKEDCPLPSSLATTEPSDKQVQGTIVKLVDQDNKQPSKFPNKEPNLIYKTIAKSAPSAVQSTQETRIDDNKSQEGVSKTAEAVSGKMMGFGSTLLSSASSLITSAVHEESRTTPPSSRKMSAAAQGSDKVSASQIPPVKSSPAVSPLKTSTKEVKSVEQKISEQTEPQVKAPPAGTKKTDHRPQEPSKVGTSQVPPKATQSNCPLCKVELNMDSKVLSNYNTCTACKSTVCNKCGFSPMPNKAEGKEWLCLNCQMQRALGASEPLGLPLIKAQPSPSKETPPPSKEKDTAIPASQEETIPLNIKVVSVVTTKESESPAVGELNDKATPAAASLPEKSGPTAIKKTNVASILPEKTPKVHPGLSQKQPLESVTSTEKVVPPTAPEAAKITSQQPAKAIKPPNKSVPPTTQPAIQESGGFFGFGGPKTQPTAAKPAESVTGKMFGFGSSFLNSASGLITSAVQDETKTTPPTPRKISMQASPKTTPPASPKTLPAKDNKAPALQKTEEAKLDKPQGKTTPSFIKDKVVKAPVESPKAPADTQGALKAAQSTCPLCKVQLNMDGKGAPNFNTCTECNATVCNQCGFNPMPNVKEVQEWLCLNCQMKRALGASEPIGPSAVIPQPPPPKITPPNSEKKDTVVQPKESTLITKEGTKVENKAPQVITPKTTDQLQQGSIPKPNDPSVDGQEKAQFVADQTKETGKMRQADDFQTIKTEVKAVTSNPADAKPPQLPSKSPTPPVTSTAVPAVSARRKSGDVSQTPKPEVKLVAAKPPDGKPPQQPSKSPTPTVKSTPPPAVSAKKESGGFFGFGAPKTQPTPSAKPAESVTGKMFGFGSSIFSSASTLITSAVPDEPKTTPLVSPKISHAKAAQKPQSPQIAKPAATLAQAKVETKPFEVTEVSGSPKADIPNADLFTCPLCKVELNKATNEPPNYNTCTECKSLVCNLCGFNPMPHTGGKEWLCLNCHTQKALLGQLGDSGKMPQPSLISVPQETQAIHATKKAEPQPPPTNDADVVTKPPSMPTSTKMVTTGETRKTETPPAAAPAKVEVQSTLAAKAVKVSPVKEENKHLVEPAAEPVKPVIVSDPTLPSVNVSKSVTVDRKEELEKAEASGEQIPQMSKLDLSEATVAVSTNEPRQLSSEKFAVKIPNAEDQIKLSEPSTSAQKVQVQEQSQEPSDVPELTPFDSHKVEKSTENIADPAVLPKPQTDSTKDMTVKVGDETAKESEKLEKSPDELENRVVSKLTPKPTSEAEEDAQPQVLPLSEEPHVEQVVYNVTKNDTEEENSLPVKEAVESGKRRHSFQAMEESSGSDMTPSPSPEVQRRKLKVTDVSSISEDLKTESADSSIEDEAFICSQIMGMGDEGEMSLSDNEKGNCQMRRKLSSEEVFKKSALDNASIKHKSLSSKGSTDNEGMLVWTKYPLTMSEATSHETVPSTTFKKAIPVIRHRQSTDEEVESITESLSKGSSSVQASSFTPGSSPTSASSLEEDSDSSPSHRRISGDKQYRKGKHRHATQPLPTIEDSTDEEKSHKEKNQLNVHGRLSPNQSASSVEDLRQGTVMDETGKTSGSEYWASIESEPEAKQAVQRGGKPSPTVIPYIPSEPFERNESDSKSLKSAKEAYEDILQKAKAIPGDSPPGVEPLYGGISIEDYLYESLVEEPKMMMTGFQDIEPKHELSPEPLKKLRSPEEVYEEMMEKKRELMMIEQEFKQAQTALESASSVSPQDLKTCVVAMPKEAISNTGESMTPESGEASDEAPVKKKKRPAPPRPTQPPKRTEVTVAPNTTSGSIGFVRPMVPLDPSLRKALFPIPDLKITQCSSGEEEDDSLADEYGVGISSEITPSDDSETKDDQSISPTLSETTEMEPISVVREIPEAKPIPTPISAPELTTTPSPVSSQSPPTSPATPDSSLESNATSSSSYQVQTPLSSDSTPLSTPTTSFLTQTPREGSPLMSAKGEVSSRESSTVIVVIPDVVSDPSKAETAELDQAKSSFPVATMSASRETPPPVIVEMPDLVSSPSQMPIEATSVLKLSAASPESVPIEAKPTAQFTESPVTSIIQGSVPSSAHVATSTVTPVVSHEPVIVQMPDLVSTTSQFSTQTSMSVSTITAQAQPNVVHSVQPAATSMIPVSAPSTTIVKKKVPPPPPPRSTSVSLSEHGGAQLPIRRAQHVSTTVASTITTAATVVAQPMQSVVVDIQPQMEDMKPDDVAVAQIVTPTRAGHVVIIVPSVENMSRIFQTPQDSTNTSTVHQAPSSQIVTDHVIVSSTTDSPLPSAKVSAVPVPPLPPKPAVRTNLETVEIPVADTPPPPLSTLPKPTIYSKSPVSALATASQVSVTTAGTSHFSKAPPPIPPKPVIIPAGLVFSHKPGESVKPPPVVAPKAATLPRTKAPPNALSLSLTRPVESNSGAMSPKSPLSPRHAKCLKTYVVITLPSEPGSPTEVITVQAPIRRGSIPATKGPGVRTTPSEQKTPFETFSAEATVRSASVPTVRHPPPVTIASTVPLQQVAPSYTVVSKVQPERNYFVTHPDQETPIQACSVPDPIKKPYTPIVMKQQQAIYQPLPSTAIQENIIRTSVIGAQIEATATSQSDSSVTQHPKIVSEDITLLQEVLPDTQIPVAQIQTMPTQQPLTQHVSILLEPRLTSDVPIPRESTVTVYSNGLRKQHEIEIENAQLQPEIAGGIIVTEAVAKSPMAMSYQLPGATEQISYSAAGWTTRQTVTEPQKDYVVTIPDVPTLPQVHHEVAPAPAISTPKVIPSFVIMESQHVTPQPQEPPMIYTPPMPCPTPPLKVIALQPDHTHIRTMEAVVRQAPMTSMIKSQAVASSERRTSMSSIGKAPFSTSEISTFPGDYDMPADVVNIGAFATTRRPSLTMQQPLVINIPAEKDIPGDVYDTYRTASYRSVEQPQLITCSSEYDCPLEIITTEAYTRRTSIPAIQDIPPHSAVAPITITKIQQESIESQEIRGPEKVVSSMSHKYSSSVSTTGQPAEIVPSLVTQVVTTEVQRTTVSVVHERLPQHTPASVPCTIKQHESKYQAQPKQNGKIIHQGDIMDLRTMKVGVEMTEKGMDLTPPELYRQSSNDPARQITAVQPEIVNLSAEVVPATTLAVVTDSITIVTCTATIASYSNTPAEKPLDLQGPVASLPLPLTTYKPCEPLAQIVYRPVNAQPVVVAVPSTAQDIPINLSYGAFVRGGQQPMTPASTDFNSVLSLEATGAMDLSNYRPVRSMVALSETSPEVITTVVEDDLTPVDLTAGRRSVCCDVIYKLPFTGSCRTQPTVTIQSDNRLVHRDNTYQYDGAGQFSIRGLNGEKTLISDASLRDVGLFPYDPNKDYEYHNGSTDGAIDLTATRRPTGKALDYTSKATAALAGMSPSPSSQDTLAVFGVSSALRTSDGIVYSSVSAPVPSTYAVTTQPGSIFSTTLVPTSTVQNESVPQQFGFISATDQRQTISYDTGLPKELLPMALADIITGYPEMYSDATLEALAASLDALASSSIFPGLDSTKMAQYQMEREFLELEKLKQLCLAEELEWERQEIQRYREQEQLMVQQELEELQALKQQLLMQQEEEHHAHMMAQQETYAQQKEQLQQIQQLQIQLQRQLDEHYGSTGTTTNLLEAKYAGVGDSGQYWPVKDENAGPPIGVQLEESQDHHNKAKRLQDDQDTCKKIIDSGVQTDDEDSAEKLHVGRRKKNKRNNDSSAPSDDEGQDESEAPAKARRRSRKHSSEGKHSSKVSSIAIQTVAEISVQTDHSGSIKRPKVQMDTKVEIIKHISAPESSQRGGSLSCQTDSDRRHTPTEVGYSTNLTTDAMARSRGFYTSVSPLSHDTSLGGQRMLTADPSRFSSCPRLKPGQKSLSDPKSLSPATEEMMAVYYADTYSGRVSPSGGTGKKVKRTLPDPPPEEVDPLMGRSGYSTNSARRRLARSTTMARAKILQDIDKELDMVERESSKLRKKQAELDEEEKEIDAKLRYLEMGINRRKEVLLKEREKRERAYLQGVAEERDYMSDSEVSNIRDDRSDGLERPRTAPQSEFDQFIPSQAEADSQYNTLTSPYSHYGQYVPQTQTTSHYTQHNLYEPQSVYHQQVSPYQHVSTLSLSHGEDQTSNYQHALLLQQGKQRQTNLSDLEPKIATNYEVIRNQPLIIVPTSSESGFGVAHLGGKYGSLDLRLGLEERSMASSPMSSISAESFYADIDHHNARNYVLIEDIGELTKASTGLGTTGLGSGFNLPDKELSKADRLLRAAEVRRTEVEDFLGQSQIQGYGKGEEDTMVEPYELKLLKQQIKQEFRRGTEGLEHLSALGLPQYLPSDSSFRHFPKGEKYSIGRLTLEKQAAKQLPAAVLYQKQMKNKKALIDPKAITKFSPIPESRDLEPDFASYMGSGASSVTNLAARARLLQDEITFGLRKNLSEQQKYLGASLGANLAGSLGQSLGMGSTIRTSVQDDGTYPSGSRSRPSSRASSRPSSVYGLDLSIKRDLSSSSLRLKTEGEVLEAAFAPGVTRTKPTSLPVGQSRGRIPIVAQNSEEESPLSPVGQPMGMARASAGPLPPISADSRDQYGSSHSLPEVQQHMREESRTCGYDRDIAFIMEDLQGAMSDSEAYHLRREDTDWFDKPRGQPQARHMADRRQMKLAPYVFPHTRVNLTRDQRDSSVSGNGLGIRVVGGKEIPGSRGEIGAYVARVVPGGVAEQTGKVIEGMQVLEWNGVQLTGKTYEEVQGIVGQPCAEAELCVRLDLNMLSDPEHPQVLEHHVHLKAVGGQRSPGVDPKQLAAELHKVSQQQAPGVMGGTGAGLGGPACLGVLSALERSALLHSGTGSAGSSGVPSPGQPASPAVNKKQRHKPTDMIRISHPITGEIQLQINYDRNVGNLIVHVLQARNLAQRDNDGYSDPFVKVYLLPGRGQVMVVQNASVDNKRRTKYAQKTMNPEWNQTVIYKNIHLEQLKKKTLEVTVWDYDRSSSNDFLGEVLIDLSNTAQLDNTPRWLPLKEQSESIEHSRAHHGVQGPPGSGAGQGHGAQDHPSGPGTGHGMGQGPEHGEGSYDSPINSVIKSRSHGIFPDPSKDLQMLPLEKSHSSPGSSKSSSDGQLRSHGPSRSQSKSSVTQAYLEDAGIAIAAAEAAVQQSRLQPRPGHRLGDISGPVVLSAPSLVGDAYGGGLDGGAGGGTGVDSAIFQVPRIGTTIPNGTDKNHMGTPENEGGKTQVMGEIKVALKKEVKTDGDQLVLEILQCRNITYKFKSPDHLPDLYVKLYVVNVATQKRIIKKKTRVCRHDREPSFNETFRFPLNPTGHSIQLFLVSNGGKFVKKTLIGEAYIWLDKVDMRKRVVSWHKLLVSSAPSNL
ncbi:protein piccolo isoform X5 [Phycodurus eques]|uniref:protein piccolo isoform X5 n=1 Tax=Phycodurus eques TaxID=693459 RepID=UPI002ACE37B5|nr:protein piccolo isoform X5 [Phycodurus eques]